MHEVRQVANLAPSTQTPAALEENQTVERALYGDLSAFNQLVVTYQRLAFSVTYRMLQDEDAAADAVQDSFIKAYRALHTFRGASLRVGCSGIVVNTCYDVLRTPALSRRQHRRRTRLKMNTPANSSTTQSPHDYAERMEVSELIEHGIRSLPADQRLALVLCDVHGYAYEEIAGSLPTAHGNSQIPHQPGARSTARFLTQKPELLPVLAS